MKYILSNEDKITLEIEGQMKKQLKGFVIVERKGKQKEWQDKRTYDLYELENEEISADFSNETLESFSKHFLTQPLVENETITTISIYHEGEVVEEFGLPIMVLVFEPDKPGYVKKIPHTQKAIHELVDGSPEYVHLGVEDMVLVCNEEGMLRNLPKHRGFYGTFLILGLENGNTVSLSETQSREVIKVFDRKPNYNSKSKYLNEYFERNEIPRKVFRYEFDNLIYQIGTESIIDFILSQESKEQLQMTELEIRDIVRNNKDIYPYLKSIGYQMAKKQYNELSNH